MTWRDRHAAAWRLAAVSLIGLTIGAGLGVLIVATFGIPWL